ncbi:MAG: pyrimidine dimer DNA glycosylase/endonuclease V [Desulfobulbales bacterium]|nr:pyrimidine dimer DNA glycosylase/endonuclease V [Desulfobulbales bacterium]
MRIWDIDAGFLNDRSLLGEHRELHGIYSIIRNDKSGYSRHPETLRWLGYLPALAIRHGLLVEEMGLRGFNHFSPIERESSGPMWPPRFIDQPARQYRLLQTKYLDKKSGRIPLPGNVQALWATHKYSVMARDPATGKTFGKQVATGEISFDELAGKLVLLLRTPPPPGRLRNTLAHMWGYVSAYSVLDPQKSTAGELLQEIQHQSFRPEGDYLCCSTALGELKFWSEFMLWNKEI